MKGSAVRIRASALLLVIDGHTLVHRSELDVHLTYTGPNAGGFNHGGCRLAVTPPPRRKRACRLQRSSRPRPELYRDLRKRPALVDQEGSEGVP